jgi:putative transposase
VALKQSAQLSELKRQLVNPEHEEISVRRQCELLDLKRSTYYYEPATESAENLRLMRLIDEQYLRTPAFGSRMMTQWFARQLKQPLNRKRVQRLMRTMGIESVAPKPYTTRRNKNHRIYPYLLRNVEINRKDQVWSTDITYVPLACGFMYLTAVIDWHTRYVLSWRLSNSLESHFCIEALEEALSIGTPEIFNTDQGSQFTARSFTSRLEDARIAISMDGRGRALDNVFVERLWWTVKYEDIYPKDYGSGSELYTGLDAYFPYYNEERKHSSLDRKTPAEVWLRNGM